MRRLLIFFFSLSLLIATAAAQCPQGDKKCALDEQGMQDNSFLVEEAYNQEYGVVQHIQSWQRNWPDGDWAHTFTQEWPVDPAPKNQLSYTIPVVHADDVSGTGVGDVLLNYRYQLVGNGGTRVAFAPRVSLVLPTGDWRRGRGMGATGVQFMLPLTVVASKRFVTHWNAGATILPGAKNALGEEANAYGYMLANSVVFLAHPRFNLMLEHVFTSNQQVAGPDRTMWQNSWLLSPGVRWAWNFSSGLQVVPGVAVPLGVGPSAGQRGVLLYLSFEHPYRKLKDSR
ncbi:MAG: transporter [Candidatus Koribacter versatilis]|uniref:Transporter n=1 Tax=Candidatus Korobacter versatilis TaxID=658062 RepID=A0A932A9Q4_9BACT|nr:transporter [Candidatus Koribacter versatilis]